MTLTITQEQRAELSVSVVLPTMNEQAGIEECIRKVRSALAENDIEYEIIVSDSSTDETPQIARELGATVIHPDANGYGNAYRRGFEVATGDLVVMGDADTTYDFSELPKLIDEIFEGADIVLGSRFQGEIKPGAMPWLHKHIGNPLLTEFLNVFYQTDITDAHSGFRVIRAEVLDELDLKSSGMEFASEMIMRASVAGFSIQEVPITYYERTGEATLDSFADGWRHVRFILLHAPSNVFIHPGIILFATGFVIMVAVLGNVTPFNQPLGLNSMIAGSLLSIIGHQIVRLGVVSTFAADPIKPIIGPPFDRLREVFSLERGMLIGIALCGIGITIALGLVINWLVSGLLAVPSPVYGLFAATIITWGVLTVFESLLVSMIAESD